MAEGLSLKKFRIPWILLAAFSILPYSNTFRVPFQFDDPYNIEEKAYVRNLRSFLPVSDTAELRGDYPSRMRTVAYATFAVNYAIHGKDVTGYHVVNLAIHLANTLLLYLLILNLFRTPAMREAESASTSRWTALFAALLFACHPVQTQAVTYIVQRIASLATFFCLACLAAYGVGRRLEEEEGTGWRPVSLYIAAAACSALAMKTKEISFTFPLVVASYEFLFFRGDPGKRILRLSPVLLTMLIVPLGLTGTGKPLGEMMQDVSAATKVGSPLSRWEYLLTEFRVIVTYIRLMVLPAGQNLDYDYPVHRSLADPEVLLSLVFLLSIAGIGLYLLQRARRGAPAHFTPVSFGILWFFLALSVESSLIPITDVIFEHRLYLPSGGFFLTAATVFSRSASWLERRRPGGAKWLATGGALILLLLAGATYARNEVWRSDIRLWEDVIRKSPAKARGYNGLGLAYAHAGQWEPAIAMYGQALFRDPGYSVALNNLGGALHESGRYREAILAYSRAIELEPENPAFVNNRGITYARIGDLERAEKDYEKAVRLNDGYADAHHNLGLLSHLQGRYGEAIDHYSRAIALGPGDPVYHSNRGLSYVFRKEYRNAIRDFATAISLAPDLADAYNGLGIAYGETGRMEEAIANFSIAIRKNPSNGGSYRNRGLAYAATGNHPEALSDFRKACELGEDDACRLLRNHE
jgi:tetratricopeptide (TPR) repeat protein